mmetsp:Transcript_30793/g.63760  ORF Transcript_30793/g.63760 Transcript_30793/m.63760 type:complete len:240 (+) Transcript_30793:541-1260(+)
MLPCSSSISGIFRKQVRVVCNDGVSFRSARVAPRSVGCLNVCSSPKTGQRVGRVILEQLIRIGGWRQHRCRFHFLCCLRAFCADGGVHRQVIQVVLKGESDNTAVGDAKMLGPGRASSSGSPSLVTVGMDILMLRQRTASPEKPLTSDSNQTRWGSDHRHFHCHSKSQHPQNESGISRNGDPCTFRTWEGVPSHPCRACQELSHQQSRLPGLSPPVPIPSRQQPPHREGERLRASLPSR